MSKRKIKNHSFLWLDGEFLRADQAKVSVFDRGLLYGDGLFETIRADSTRVHFLDDHLRRLRDSARALRIELPGSEHLPHAIHGLLDLNGLLREAARIRITVTRGTCTGPGLPASTNPTILVTAEPYRQPAPEEYEQGWKLVVIEGPHAPPLAAHKTLNYLCYLQARQAAFEQGGDEAVVLGPGLEAAEATTGSILLRADEKWTTPDCPYRLAGITLGKVTGLLENRDVEVASFPVSLEDLKRADTIWILNSMIGVMPVSHLDGVPVRRQEAEKAAEIRAALFSSP